MVRYPRIALATLPLATLACCVAFAQGAERKNDADGAQTLLVDLPHCSHFWQNPGSRCLEKLTDTARELKLQTVVNREPLTASRLASCRILFMHIPKKTFSPEEIKAIRGFMKSGGSLFVAMDEDRWTTLQQCNINELLEPFDIKFGDNWPQATREERVGGQARDAAFLSEPLSIPCHGARTVEGGTAFCFARETPDRDVYQVPYGVYRELDGGGRIIAMSEGMASLYMNRWKGEGYQCDRFMSCALGWLASPTDNAAQGSPPKEKS